LEMKKLAHIKAVPTRNRFCKLLLIVALTLVLLMGMSSAAFASFPDVPQNHPYYTQIMTLANHGIINGYGNGYFGPNDPVSRQQFAKMVIGTINAPINNTETCPFTDVDKTRPYPYSFVSKCYQMGIATGVTSTTFQPYNNIIRAQVATMVVRAATASNKNLSTPPPGYNPYSAYNVAPHDANIRLAAYNNLFVGLSPQNTFAYFNTNASRGETAVMLYNLGKLLGRW